MRLLLFLFLCLGHVTAYTQESSSTVEAGEIQETEPADDADSKKPVEIETPDTFEATEKLSEDISAPFPVDI